MKTVHLWMAMAVMSLTLISPAGTAAQSDPGEAIDAYIRERMAALNAPGAAVAVVQNGEIVHLAGFGVANEAGDPLTPQTPVLLASLSKSMTSVAVMQLVEQGLIELDSPIQEYLPWFMPATPITVRQLLNQTSGLDELEGYERNLDPGGPDGLARSIRDLAETDLNRPPGTAFEYSNSNADTLGLLIETVSGQKYSDYMAAHVFAPLGMTGAYTSLEAARAAGMGQAFHPFFGRQTNLDAIMAYTSAVQPSAGLIAGAEDMARYLLLHLNDGRAGDSQLLSPESMATLHERGVIINPETGLGYAMGWFIWTFEEATLPGDDPPTALSHGGDWLGHKTMMLIIPERDLGVFTYMSGSDDARDAAFENVIFNVALLASGLDPSIPAPQPAVLDTLWQPIGIGVILFLLASAVWSFRKLRMQTFSRRDAWIFVALAALDVFLIAYFLLVQLPANLTTVPLMLRFGPDLGLMLVIVLILTAGWGTIRSLWAFQRRRAESAESKKNLAVSGHELVMISLVVLIGVTGLAACGTTEIAPPTPPPSTPPSRDYWPTEGWRDADPAALGMDATTLDGLNEQVARDLPFLNSLLVVKDGYLVHEAYYNAYDADDPHTTNSVTKSVVSALYGQALAEGLIAGLDTTLEEALPAYFEGGGNRDAAGITLGDLLRMRSGLAWDEARLEEELSTAVLSGGVEAGIAFFKQMDLAEYVLQSGVAYPPGEAWVYNSSDTNLLSAAFSALAGRSLADYAGDTIFPALGIAGWNWIEDANGVNIGGIGLEMTPRDMAKFGYLVLNRGQWDGRQLLPAEWVYSSTYPQSDGLFPGNGQTMPIDWYGMQWWNWRPEVFAGHRAIAAQGYAGQLIILVPDLDLILVTTADTLVPPDVAEVQMARVYDLVKHVILPAAGDSKALDPFWSITEFEPPPTDILYTAGPDGRDEAPLFDDPGFTHWGPAWSPDGQQVVFSRGKPTSPVIPGSPATDLYVANIDGTNIRQLTRNGRLNYLPAWSPDGRRIAFISGTMGLDSHEVYVINADGSGEMNLTNNDVQEYGVAWSPDGRRLAFGTKLAGDMQIYTMSPDGTEQQPLPVAAAGMAPSWSPDGAHIVFASERNGNADLYVMDADGGNQRPLVTGEAWDYLPSWSPGGDQIAFTSTRDGAAAIYVIPAEGGEPRRISGRDLVADVASWSPDGTRLVFHGREN